LSEIAFLKRKFVRGHNPVIPPSVFVGEMSLLDIYEIVRHERRGAGRREREATVRAALTEAALHGEDEVLKLVKYLSNGRGRGCTDALKGLDIGAIVHAVEVNFSAVRTESVIFPHVLSNLTLLPKPIVIQYQGKELVCPSVEHAYQIKKCIFHEKYDKLENLTKLTAIRCKQKCAAVQSDKWNGVKYNVMIDLLNMRYDIDPSFRGSLKRGVRYLHPTMDLYWGTGRGGHNHFGKALMEVAFLRRNDLAE